MTKAVRSARQQISRLGQAAPASRVEPDRLIRSGAARELRALRGPTVGEDGLRLGPFGGGKKLQRFAHGGQVFRPVLGLAEADGDVPADECEAEFLEAIAQVVAPTEVAGRAELGSFIARVGNRRKHSLGSGDVG